MAFALESLIAAGTKLWLDSVDPDLVVSNRKLGATGATSNPIIIGDLIASGRFDSNLQSFIEKGMSDSDIAWAMTDRLVSDAQKVFHKVWQDTHGNDGYVSFELDPLLEDTMQGPPHEQRVKRYIELGKKWSAGHDNRMIKVPATPAGLAALEDLAAHGITLNVTLIFTMRQYEAARDAIWRGAQRRKSLDKFKSVYSIFVSRVDVYTEQHVSKLSDDAQGMVGIVNAKDIWRANHAFWADKKLKLQQEMIFASTGVKKEGAPPDVYVEALAGSDIQTNPPKTNEAIQAMGKTYVRRIDDMPPAAVLDDIARKVNVQEMERVLMSEGLAKFADPQKKLLSLIASKRAALAPSK